MDSQDREEKDSDATGYVLIAIVAAAFLGIPFALITCGVIR